MDAFFDNTDSTNPPSPAHTPSPPTPIDQIPSYGSPSSHYPPPDFDSSKSYYPDSYPPPSGSFTPPSDYHFAPASAPEMSHVDMVHQEITAAHEPKIVSQPYWSPSPDMSTHTPTPVNSQANNSFLSELYASEPMQVTQSSGVSPDALSTSGPSSPNWSIDGQEPTRQLASPHYTTTISSADDHHLLRRASCPSWNSHNEQASQPRDDVLPPVSTLLFDHHRIGAQQQPSPQPFDSYHRFDVHTPPEGVSTFELRPVIYGESTYAGEPASFHTRSIDETFIRPSPTHEFSPFEYEPKSQGNSPTMVNQAPMGVTPHHQVPIMHTDDAASKETQYLRRRCFNCHATEPPSWRRSTLNPGKIVCNKCGLYERTHLRPRPHRFDELRGGAAAAKSRKTSKTLITGLAGSGNKLLVKNEATITRRTSMASMTSTSSENWDEYSVSSTSSTPPFNSPTALEFGVNAQSGIAGPITLPQPPLLPRPRNAPRKTSSASLRGQWPTNDFAAPAPPASIAAGGPRRTLPGPQEFLSRRPSFDVSTLAAQRRQQIPIETGWQTIPLEEVRPRNARKPAPGPINTSRTVAA
ncbi:hypothetical protein FRB99_004561 [Tulasnella sp. 403]|nr:hypothetical protein FRB99_004561 [Tulasnella sp. 403]